jgi:hypothetical protein
MNPKKKNLIRVVVAVALFAWPGVETYRYFLATQNLAATEQLLGQVQTQLAQAKARQQPAVTPVSNNLDK